MDRKHIFAATREEHELVMKLYGPDPAEQRDASYADDDGYDLSSVPDVEDLALLSGGFDETSEHMTLVRKIH